jgi:hypothetical protein
MATLAATIAAFSNMRAAGSRLTSIQAQRASRVGRLGDNPDSIVPPPPPQPDPQEVSLQTGPWRIRRLRPHAPRHRPRVRLHLTRQRPLTQQRRRMQQRPLTRRRRLTPRLRMPHRIPRGMSTNSGQDRFLIKACE